MFIDVSPVKHSDSEVHQVIIFFKILTFRNATD